MLNEFYLKDYEGKADCASIFVPVGGAVRLPDQQCKFVRLARWNVTDDELFTVDATANRLEANNEVYYGFNGKLFGQLYMSDTTDLIPVSNCNQITLRLPSKVAGAGRRVYFSWYY